MSMNAAAFAMAVQYHQAGALDMAEQLYRQIVQSEPSHADAWAHLGAACLARGRSAEAATSYRRALELRPGQASFHLDLGVALAQLGQLEDAAGHFRQAAALNPNSPDAYSNLGVVLSALGKGQEALKVYEQALRLRPDFAQAHNNLGLALMNLGRTAEAEASYRKALQLQPNYGEALCNLGIALLRQGHPDQALPVFQQILASQPNFAEAHNGMCLVSAQLGRFDESLASLERLLALCPDYAQAHWNRSILWLLQGDFERGWREYEWRLKCQPFVSWRFEQPLWDGSPLGDRAILLYAEQGLGDTLHFIRYAPLVKQYGGRVIVECQKPLAAILGRCKGIDELIVRGATRPRFDVRVPLLSLPRILGTTLATVPADVPYLAADANLVEYWRREFASVPGFKIGIAWQGDPAHPGDRYRSIPLAHFEQLARVYGTSLVSLQKGPGSEQLGASANRFRVTDLGSQLDEKTGAFMDTAAVMKNLDLVVTADTSIAHLAGALGVPVWVALALAPDWRWLLERQDSPWYPTMRLFRQHQLDDWNDVFGRMAIELARKVASAR